MNVYGPSRNVSKMPIGPDQGIPINSGLFPKPVPMRTILPMSGAVRTTVHAVPIPAQPQGAGRHVPGTTNAVRVTTASTPSVSRKRPKEKPALEITSAIRDSASMDIAAMKPAAGPVGAAHWPVPRGRVCRNWWIPTRNLTVAHA